MFRLFFMVASISASAIGAASYLANNQEKTEAAVTVARDQMQSLKAKQTAALEENQQKTQPAQINGTERIARSPNGHFMADFTLNNARVHALIDTGASTIAMNEKTARRAGLRLRSSDFIYEVTTANGKAKAARAVLKTVKIGSIRMRDVEALVLEDRALSTTLIGMSFMNRLRSFEYKSGNLVLRR